MSHFHINEYCFNDLKKHLYQNIIFNYSFYLKTPNKSSNFSLLIELGLRVDPKETRITPLLASSIHFLRSSGRGLAFLTLRPPTSMTFGPYCQAPWVTGWLLDRNTVNLFLRKREWFNDRISKIFPLHYFITDWQVWIHLPDPDCMDSAVEPVHVGVGHHVHHVVHQSLLQSHGLDVPAWSNV